MRFVLEITEEGERECEESGTSEALADMLLQASRQVRDGHTDSGLIEMGDGEKAAQYKLTEG